MIIGRQKNSVGTMVSTNRTSWIANIAIPDSISTNMIYRSVLPPPICWSEVGLTSRNTLMILNTIKLVTRAFTIKDMPRLGRINLDAQYVLMSGSVIKYVEPLLPNQVAGNSKL